MSGPSSISWTDLFSTNKPPDVSLELRVLKKAGEPFLILPSAPGLAAKSLSLYPAQRTKAKFARKMLGVAFSVGLPLPLHRASLQISTQGAFARFLMQLAGGESRAFPSFAILAGNPNAEGRRFLLLLFDEQQQPAFVVKVGITEAARRLIQSESSFLQGMKGRPGLPKFCGSVASDHLEAFALEYIEGESPTREDRPVIGKLMEGWLDRNRKVCVRDVPAWQALEKAVGAIPGADLIRRMGEDADFTFHPTLFHGDFAPWNIKVSSRQGTWTVIDWERGDTIGFPAWDWFHYVIQTGALVEKLAAEALLERFENLIADPIFQHYAEIAGIKGKEKLLGSLYLSHLIHVIQPGDGIETDKALLTLICSS